MKEKIIKRDLLVKITKNLKSGFINLIYGPRRVGKTILLRQLQEYFLKKIQKKELASLMAIPKKHVIFLTLLPSLKYQK